MNTPLSNKFIKEIKLFLVILSLSFYYIAVSQNGTKQSIDSLRLQIKNAKTIDEAFLAKTTLVLKYYLSGDKVNTDILYKEVLKEGSKVNSQQSLSSLYNMKGTLFYYNSKFDSALYYFEKCLYVRKRLKDEVGVIKTLNNIGSIYYSLSDYRAALSYYEEGLKLETKLNYDEGTYVSINNIGYIYHALRIPTKSVKVFKKAEKMYLKKKELSSLYYTYDGLSIVYNDLNKDCTFFYAHKSEEIAQILNNKYLVCSALLNIGELYTQRNLFYSAKTFLDSALNLSIKINDKRIELAVYRNLMKIEMEEYRLNNAFSYVEKIIALQKQLNIKADVKDYARLFAEFYYRKKDFELAYNYLNIYGQYKDSIYNFKTTALINEMETKYQSEKIDQENQRLQNENNAQKTMRNYLIIVICLAAVTIAGAFFAIRKISKSNKMLALQKNAIEQKNDLLELQKNEISSQKAIVDEKQKEIIDSINYAKRIQNGLFTSGKLINVNIKDSFMMFKPKDIVSGDFYWSAEHEGNFYIAVCDSTGHGVPGAFMSLLNIGFLSEAIKEKDIKEPHHVLNYVRNRLIETISKDGQQDGMDGILMCFETTQTNSSKDKIVSKITYAASNNAPILVRHGELQELPKDKMPIGKGESIDSFTLYTIDAIVGDMIYLYTDGYADQFGGEKGKKMKYKLLNEVLLSNSTKELDVQLEQLNRYFEDWKGNLEQVDDVCVLGIRI